MGRVPVKHLVILLSLFGILTIYNNCDGSFESYKQMSSLEDGTGSGDDNNDDSGSGDGDDNGDGGGDPMPVDDTAPVLTFTQVPLVSTTETSATFTFMVTDSGSGLQSVQCSLDGAPFANCTSPVMHSGLSMSSHSFRVQAQDMAGNFNLITHNWTITADNGGNGGGSISIALNPARTTGVAPLSIFFDATGTTASSTNRPFHDLEYRWDFGDPTSGNWTKGTQVTPSRNSGTGPVASHVFEKPGNYTVTLTVTDATNVRTATVQITVQDPEEVFAGSNTIVVSTDGTFAGKPAGAQERTTSNFATVLGYASAGKRILLKRGQTWTISSTAELNTAGPGIIGAWGIAGAKPIINYTGSDVAINLARADWRLMDLDIRGKGGGAAGEGVAFSSGADKILLLRVDLSTFTNAFMPNPYALGSGAHLFEDVAFVDGSITNNSAYGMYAAGRRFTLMGNLFHKVNTEHVVRIHQMWKGVIAHNIVSGGVTGKHLVKLHAPCRSGSGCDVIGALGTNTFSEDIVISDNKFITGSEAWQVGLSPQNDTSDERLRNIIVERNISQFQSGRGMLAWRVAAQDVTLRNNVINMTGGNSDECFGFSVARAGMEPAARNVHIYNNTMYFGSNANYFAGIEITSSASDTRVINNLGYAPQAATVQMISGSGNNLVASNNSTNAQIKSSPGFSNPSVGDFRLTSGSYGVNAGANVPIFWDFMRNLRKNGSNIDLGAFEF